MARKAKITTSFMIEPELLAEVKRVAGAQDVSLGHALRQGARLWLRQFTTPKKRGAR